MCVGVFCRRAGLRNASVQRGDVRRRFERAEAGGATGLPRLVRRGAVRLADCGCCFGFGCCFGWQQQVPVRYLRRPCQRKALRSIQVRSSLLLHSHDWFKLINHKTIQLKGLVLKKWPSEILQIFLKTASVIPRNSMLKHGLPCCTSFCCSWLLFFLLEVFDQGACKCHLITSCKLQIIPLLSLPSHCLFSENLWKSCFIFYVIYREAFRLL